MSCTSNNEICKTNKILQLVVMIILIPLPLFFAQTIYGVRGLEAWVIIGIIWTFLSAFTVVIYPLYESREALLMVSRGFIKVRVLKFGPHVTVFMSTESHFLMRLL